MRRRNKILHVVLFILIGVFIFNGVEAVFRYQHENSYYPSNDYYFENLYQLPRNSLDVVYVGTSQFHCGISPLDIWNEEGITGYVFSATNCRAWLAYYEIREILKYQTPSVIVLDAAVPRGDKNDAGQRDVLNSMRFSKNKLEAFKYCYDLEGKSIDEMINTCSEFFAYHDKWDTLDQHDFENNKNEQYDLKGYLYATSIIDYDSLDHEENARAEVTELSEKTQLYMKKIKDLCDEKGIELLLVKTPSDAWNDTYFQMINEWALENHTVFLDMNYMLQEMDFDMEESLFDANHMNYHGAESTSAYLGDYLAAHYHFDDTRSDDIRNEWNQDYNNYIEYKNSRLVAAEEDFDRYLELIRKEDYIICMAVKDEASMNLTASNLKRMRDLGVEGLLQNQFRNSYIAVVDGGEVIHEQVSEQKLEFAGKLSCGIEVEISSAGYLSENQASILIDGTEYALNMRGINFVIYDKKSRQVIDQAVVDVFEDGSIYRERKLRN